MKILIVDDEILVRIGLKSCIEWEKYGFEIIGEAEDGVKALEQIVLLKPDIILLDIKMPKLDGLSVMNRINEMKLDCRVVILSSFDDYEHIGEAMKLGMSDYLHKPRMSAQDILDSLLSVKETIEKSRKFNITKQTELMLKDNALNKDTMLHRLLSGITDENIDVFERLSAGGAKIGRHSLHCILFSVKSLEAVLKRYEGSARTLLQQYITNIMKSLLENEKTTEFLCFSDNLYCVIVSSEAGASESKLNEKTVVMINTVADALKQFLNIDLRFGISDITRNATLLGSSFSQALKALSVHFYKKSAGIIYFAEINTIDFTTARKHSESLVGELRALASSKKYEDFRRVFKILEKELNETGCLSAEEVKSLFAGLLFLLQGNQSSLKIMDEVSQYETFADLVGFFESQFDSFSNFLTENSVSDEYPFLIKRIINYLNDSYANDISLQLLSSVLKVSPNYISRVFKSETGQALFDYLNSVRVEKSKKLLEDGNLKIYEVGYKVGFKSSVHFNVVFGKMTGKSPKQYRDTLKL